MISKGKLMFYKRQGQVLYLDSIRDLAPGDTGREVCRIMAIKRDQGVRWVEWKCDGVQSKVQEIPEGLEEGYRALEQAKG